MVTKTFIDYCKAFEVYIDEDELGEFVLYLMDMDRLYKSDELEEVHRPKAVALKYCEAFQKYIPDNKLGEVVMEILDNFHSWGTDDEKP